jgi:hypothetical protein
MPDQLAAFFCLINHGATLSVCQARGVRTQGDRVGRQGAQGRGEEKLHGQMSEGASLVRSRSESATALMACVLLFAGATAAAAQTQNYPASPYFSPQTAPKAPSPYFGTNPNQNRNRGYLSTNPYDPNSIYGAGTPSRPDQLRNPGGTGGIDR